MRGDGREQDAQQERASVRTFRSNVWDSKMKTFMHKTTDSDQSRLHSSKICNNLSRSCRNRHSFRFSWELGICNYALGKKSIVPRF